MNKQMGGDGTVGKALEILDAVASFDKPVRFSELLHASPYPKATLYRFVQSLTNQNMLSHDAEQGTYSLGARLVRLAHVAWKNASLAPIARTHIESLAEAVNQTVHLAQIDHGQVLFVDKLKPNDHYETKARVGMVAPAFCTGVGKAMMAYMAPKRLELVMRQQAFVQYTPATLQSADCLAAELEQIRKDGVAFDREEHEAGIVSIAAPVLSDNGRMIGAISVATSVSECSLKELQGFKPLLLETAENIGAEATSWQFPS